MNKGIMYKIDHLSFEEQEQLISTLPENIVAINQNYYQQEFFATLNSINLLTYLLTAVMVIIFSVALGNLNIVLFANHQEELRLLHSIDIPHLLGSGELSRANSKIQSILLL